MFKDGFLKAGMFETRIKTGSPKETLHLGEKLGIKLPLGTTLALFGELGSGKTTFSKGLAIGATGNQDLQVDSPTFVYLNIYEGQKTLYHFDTYRMPSMQVFIDEGFDEFFEGDGICVVEWPEKIERLLPENTLKVFFSQTAPNEREIRILSHEKMEL